MFTIEVALVVFDDLARFPRLARGFRSVVGAMLDDRQSIGGKMVANIEPMQPVDVGAEDQVGIGQQGEIAGILVSGGDGMPRVGSQRFNNVSPLTVNHYPQGFGSLCKETLRTDTWQQTGEKAEGECGLHNRFLNADSV